MKKIICVLSLLTASLQAAAPQYTIVPLAVYPLPGALNNYGWSSAINNKGEVVGPYQTTVQSPIGGTAIYTVDGPTYLPSFVNYPLAINDSRQIATGINSAGIYDNGITTTLSTGNGAATAINNAGTVAGYYNTSSNLSDPNPRAFVYANGQRSNLFNDSLSSSANGINQSGKITGYHGGNAFIYDNGSVTTLGTFGGATSQGNDINDAGQVTGYATTSEGRSHAFLSTGTSLLDLGTLPGYTNSVGQSVNNAGQVLGFSYQVDGGGNPVNKKDFIYSEGTMYELTSVLPILLGGAQYQSAEITYRPSINDFGQIAWSILDFGRTPINYPILLNPTKPIRKVSGNSVNAKVVSGMAFSEVGPQTGSGGFATNVSIVGGTATANRDVTTTIDNTIHLNLASDVVDVSGTGSDTFVLQLSYNEAAAISLLGAEGEARLLWLNTLTSQWVNAVDGNTGGTSFFAGDGAYDAATDFQLGTYGVDTTSNTVWAVINHNSEFGAGSAVPEPSTWAMLAVFGGMAGIVFLRNRRKVS